MLVAGDGRHPEGGGAGELENLRHLGRLAPADLASWLGRAAIYALPARYEPFGLSILEAALAGCALVLGDIDSLRELWDGCALFVPPEDDDALAEALNRSDPRCGPTPPAGGAVAAASRRASRRSAWPRATSRPTARPDCRATAPLCRHLSPTANASSRAEAVLVYGDTRRIEEPRREGAGDPPGLERWRVAALPIERHALLAELLVEAGELEQGLLDAGLACEAAASRLTRAAAGLLLASFRTLGQSQDEPAEIESALDCSLSPFRFPRRSRSPRPRATPSTVSTPRPISSPPRARSRTEPW